MEVFIRLPVDLDQMAKDLDCLGSHHCQDLRLVQIFAS
jgi:hypothetical protein